MAHQKRKDAAVALVASAVKTLLQSATAKIAQYNGNNSITKLITDSIEW